MIGVTSPWHSQPGNRLATGRLRGTNGSSLGKQRSRGADRSRKFWKQLPLRLLLSTDEKYEHSHLPATRARGFPPNHPIPVVIICRQISLRTTRRIVKILTFRCGLRHWRRSLQYVCTCEAKNPYALLHWNRRSALHVVFHSQPAHVSFGDQEFGNGKTAVVSWLQ